MANELPAFLQRLMPASQSIGQDASGGIMGFPQPPHISTRNNRFHLVNAAGEEDTLRDIAIEVVIVASNPVISRVYYGRPFDPNVEALPPKCFSDNGVAPSIQAMEPQHANCAGCPQAVWGSATSQISGKGVPACSQRKKLAVLYDGELYQFVVPPASMAALKTYMVDVKGHASVIKTEIAFDDKKTGILTFKATSFIDEEMSNKVFAITSDPASTVKLLGTDDKPLEDMARIGAGTRNLEEATAKVLEKPTNAPYTARAIEERIVNEKPDFTEGKANLTKMQFGDPHAAMYPGIQQAPAEKPKRTRAAGARQQLQASIEDTKPEVSRDTPPQFGMTEATPAVNDDQLKALLAGAVGFANKQ